MAGVENNILVVEDNPKDAHFLEELIKSLGYKVWIVPEGKEALKLIKQVDFCVVLTEMHMPGLSSLELARKVQKISPMVSVIVMTIYTYIDLAVEAMEAGARGYITKPFNSSEIRIALEQAGERYKLLCSGRETEQLVEFSVKDGLTGVYNRRSMDLFIRNKIVTTHRMTEKFSILIIDLDYFKKYNDTNGHLAGDELLREVCKLLGEFLRQGDVIFRYGGEEFLVFLGHTGRKDAALIAERIRNLVSLYSPITISIGVGTFPDDGGKLEDLIRGADKALYRAKEEGRDKVCLAGTEPK